MYRLDGRFYVYLSCYHNFILINFDAKLVNDTSFYLLPPLERRVPQSGKKMPSKLRKPFSFTFIITDSWQRRMRLQR